MTFLASASLFAALSAGETVIAQGTNVAPNGDRLEVTSKCLRLNGRAIVPVMGEIHYSRVPRDEWASSLSTMKDGGVSIVSTYVFWNHHEWKEDVWDFSGNRDLSAFLGEVEKAGLWAIVRIGPWDHGECREGGFPDWLVDKAYGWAGGDAKRVRSILRSRDARFMAETAKLFRRLYPEIAPHFWKNGGAVVGIQLENESRGPWPYYQALKDLAVETGYDVPMYTRTGWPKLNGPETTFGEMIPLYGDYAEGFWDRTLDSMPGAYRDAFAMRPARTSAVIATEQLGVQKAEDAKDAARYPYFTCELGGGMASSYHRRLSMEPLDAFAIGVVKLGSGSNMPGYYMYHGGSNPTDFGVNMAESQRGRFTNYNDLPVVSYEFLSPVSEFGERQEAYWMVKALAGFCRDNAEELAVADPVFVNSHETRRGRFVFHNDYVRRINPEGECWIGVEKDGKIERILDGRSLAKTVTQGGSACADGVAKLVYSVPGLKLLKPAGTPPAVATGPAGVAIMPDESAWDAAAVYSVPFEHGDKMLEISYEGDMARLYADGKLVQDDFWKGRPIRYALRRLPAGTKELTLKVLPWGEGAAEKIFVDGGIAAETMKLAGTVKGGYAQYVWKNPALGIGNYDVRVVLGDPVRATTNFVKFAGRRLAAGPVTTKPGEIVDFSFTARVPGPYTTRKGDAKSNFDLEVAVFTLGANGEKAVPAPRVSPAPESRTIYLCGDSTVTDQRNEPWGSWGQILPAFVKPGWAVSNFAKSGLALKTFEGEGRLARILEHLREGDWVVVQFGHNDQKIAGEEPENGYARRLREWVELFRGKGASVVLVTPVERRRFDEKTGEHLGKTLLGYSDAVKSVAAEKGVPLIDLNDASYRMHEKLGASGSKRIQCNNRGKIDNTHHNIYGAYEMARIVAAGLAGIPVVEGAIRDGFRDFDPENPDSDPRVPPSGATDWKKPEGS